MTLEEGGETMRTRFDEALTDISKIKIVESFAITLYTDFTYKKVNPPLRQGLPPEGLETFYKAMCSGLTKLPVFKGRVYRIVELSRDEQEFYENNDEVLERAFMSTSASKDARRAFQNNTNKNYNTYFYIQSKTGRMITHLSVWKEEQEVLFPAGTSFKVLDTFRPYFSNTLYVWLEEI